MNDKRNELQDLLLKLSGKKIENFQVISEPIDMNIQLAYLEFKTKDKLKYVPEFKPIYLDELKKSFISLQDWSKNMCILGSSGDVEILRLLESIYDSFVEDKKQWCYLAIKDIQMTLESELLETSSVYISTGLGGKGSKIRYFAAMIVKDKSLFSNSDFRSLIKGEIDMFFMQKYHELELVNVTDKYITIKFLKEILEDVQGFIKQLVEKLKEYGDLFEDSILITNVKELPENEIMSYIDKINNNEIQ